MITMKKLAKQAYQATLKDNGFSEGQGAYMVAIKDYEKILPSLTEQALYDYITHVKSINPDYTIGTWYDEEKTGLYYLDVSLGFDDKEKALDFAHENDQLAIYDVINDNTIYL